ncbi:MAG: hypothetical protein R2766_10180 [Saprospiraceae bacterium]
MTVTVNTSPTVTISSSPLAPYVREGFPPSLPFHPVALVVLPIYGMMVRADDFITVSIPGDYSMLKF